jgi:hypothetical protein
MSKNNLYEFEEIFIALTVDEEFSSKRDMMKKNYDD